MTLTHCCCLYNMSYLNKAITNNYILMKCLNDKKTIILNVTYSLSEKGLKYKCSRFLSNTSYFLYYHSSHSWQTTPWGKRVIWQHQLQCVIIRGTFSQVSVLSCSSNLSRWIHTKHITRQRTEGAWATVSPSSETESAKNTEVAKILALCHHNH